MNILILSAGTRNKIVEYFRQSLIVNEEKIGNVIATDASPLAPALFEADKYYIVPRINEEGYLDKVIEICKKEDIKGMLSLIDPELSIISKNKGRFEELGVTIIGSPYKVNEIALDKIKMYEWLKDNGFKTGKSYLRIEDFKKDLTEGEIRFPAFVKPIKGSASLDINKVYNLETVEFLLKNQEGLMIQEFLDGQEIGADVYIDLITKEVVSIFTKKKLLMRAGETDKAVSFKDYKLFELIEKFVKEFGFVGQIDIDIFEINGDYFISEVNPRFGGGYPHAYESGVNNMKLIINNLNGIPNEKKIGSYDEGIYMMKYNEVMIKEEI